MRLAVLLAVTLTLALAPFAPASFPVVDRAHKCCAETHKCCTDACPCPVTCVLPASAAAMVPAVAQVSPVVAASVAVPRPDDEWAAALPQRPPVPPPRA